MSHIAQSRTALGDSLLHTQQESSRIIRLLAYSLACSDLICLSFNAITATCKAPSPKGVNYRNDAKTATRYRQARLTAVHKVACLQLPPVPRVRLQTASNPGSGDVGWAGFRLNTQEAGESLRYLYSSFMRLLVQSECVLGGPCLVHTWVSAKNRLTLSLAAIHFLWARSTGLQ